MSPSPFSSRPRICLRSIAAGFLRRTALAFFPLLLASGASARDPIPGPPPGYLEIGLPPFDVLGTEALGLSAPAESFNFLPDGRAILVGNREIAAGDGQRWEVFRQIDDNRLLNTASAIVDDAGSIYLGTPGGFSRVVLESSGQWRLEEEGRLPEDLQSVPLIMNQAAQVAGQWFWWAGGTLVSWKPGQEARFIGRFDAIERIVEIDGIVYFSDAATGRLYRISPEGQVELVSVPGNAYVDSKVTAAVALGSGRTLVGTAASGLLVHENGRFESFQTSGVFTGHTHISDLCAVGDGLFAAAVDNYGIVFFDRTGRILQTLTRGSDHRLARTQRLLNDAPGTVWALLSDGVARIGFPTRFSDFGPLIPTAMNYVRPFRHEGLLWLMADGRAQRAIYDADKRLTGFEIDTPGGYLTDMPVIDGMLLGCTQAGIFKWDGPGSWSLLVPDVTSPHILPKPAVEGTWAYAAENEVGWFRRTENGYAVERFPEPGLGHVYDLITDDKNVAWLELGSGRVGRLEIDNLEKPTVKVYTTDEGLAGGWAQLFRLGPDIRVNIPPTVFRFDTAGDRFVPDIDFQESMPGIENIASRPVIDTNGHFWLPHRGRVEVYKDLEAIGSGQATPMTALDLFAPLHLFPQADGSMWVERPGRFFKYDPHFQQTQPAPLRGIITRVVSPISGETWIPSNNRWQPLELPSTSNALIIHFAAPGTAVGHAVTFEIQTDRDHEWIDLGSGGYTTLSRIQPGRHTIKIRPRDSHRVGDATQLSFTVLAPWYRTAPAYVGFALFSVFMVLGLFILNNLRAKRQQAVLEDQVARRTSDLNQANAELQRQIEKTIEEFDRRRRIEAQLQQSRKLESLGTLAGGIAHDFNNILAAIRGHTELALLHALEGSELRESLLEIRNGTARARDLVARILTFARHQTINPQPVNLAAVIAEAANLVRPTLPASITLSLDLQPVHVLVDNTQIHQVILNLCSNAVHAIDSREGRITVRLFQSETPPTVTPKDPKEEVRLRETPQWAVLEVQDSGPGMNKETRNRIFDPFFTTKPVGKGTGLGLSTVQGIIAQHHGFITVESTPGLGTTFTIHIPAIEVPDSAPSPSETPASRGSGERVIVVDDEHSLAKATARLLERRGFATIVFSDPRDALEAFRRAPESFSAAVIDLTMPGMTGTELAEAMHLLQPHFPVVFVSGFGHTVLNGTKTESDNVKFLIKPFEPDDLVQALLTLIESRTGS